MRVPYPKVLIVGGAASVAIAACGPVFPTAFTAERLNYLPTEMRNALVGCTSNAACEAAASNVRGAAPNVGQCSAGYCLFSRATPARCYEGEIKDCKRGDPGWCGRSMSQCTYASGAPTWQQCFSRNDCSGSTPASGTAVCADPPTGPAREIPATECMDLGVRASKGVPFPSTQRIGLNVVITKRDSKAIVNRSKVDADIAQANQVFAPDVEFHVATFEETDSISPDVSNSVGSDKIFEVKGTLPLLYVATYTDGGGVAWSSGNGTVVALNGSHAIVAHELAHALGLSHTYNVDDFVADTGFAPSDCTFSSACKSASTCKDCRYSSCPAEASENPRPDPQNIMAWARGQVCNVKVTPGQRELVRCTLRTSQKRLIAAPPCSCPSGFSCVGTNCVCHKTLCGNACVSLGTDQNCTKCGDVCANGARCQGSPKACVAPPVCPEGSRDCGLDCNGDQVCIPKNKPGGCPNFPCK